MPSPYVLFPLAVNHLDSGVVGIINFWSHFSRFWWLVLCQKPAKPRWQGVTVGLIGAALDNPSYE